MLNRMSRLHCRLAVLLAVSSAGAGVGYLPTVGPVPLRFETPPAPKPAHRPLPPLEQFDASRPAVPCESAAADAALAPAQPSGEPVSAVSPAPLPAVTNLVQAPPPVAEVVTPQMFVKYFTGARSNAPANAVFLPVGFRPALPNTGNSSTATYTVGP